MGSGQYHVQYLCEKTLKNQRLFIFHKIIMKLIDLGAEIIMGVHGMDIRISETTRG